jgi:hypothetical protein
VNVLKGMLSGVVASMVAKVDLVGDYTNKSCRSTSISRIIATRILQDVIISVTRHKNLKLSRTQKNTILHLLGNTHHSLKQHKESKVTISISIPTQ